MADLATLEVEAFFCPSETVPQVRPVEYLSRTAEVAGTTYGINIGTATNPTQRRVGCQEIEVDEVTGEETQTDGCTTDGITWKNAEVRFAQVTDGLSHTIAFSESILGDGSRSRSIPGKSELTQFRIREVISRVLTGIEFVGPEAVCNATEWDGRRMTEWLRSSGSSSPVIQGYHTPNSNLPDIVNVTELLTGPRSYHPGGVNIALCDGSTQFLVDDVELAPFRALWTRAGGEVDTAF